MSVSVLQTGARYNSCFFPMSITAIGNDLPSNTGCNEIYRLHRYSGARNSSAAVEINCYIGAWCSVEALVRDLAHLNSSCLKKKKKKIHQSPKLGWVFDPSREIRSTRLAFYRSCLDYLFLARAPNIAVVLIDDHRVLHRVEVKVFERDIPNVALPNLLQVTKKCEIRLRFAFLCFTKYFFFSLYKTGHSSNLPCLDPRSIGCSLEERIAHMDVLYLHKVAILA